MPTFASLSCNDSDLDVLVEDDELVDDARAPIRGVLGIGELGAVKKAAGVLGDSAAEKIDPLNRELEVAAELTTEEDGGAAA